MLDRRTKEWRRRGELVAAFTAALGGAAALSPILEAKVDTAAELFYASFGDTNAVNNGLSD